MNLMFLELKRKRKGQKENQQNGGKHKNQGGVQRKLK